MQRGNGRNSGGRGNNNNNRYGDHSNRGRGNNHAAYVGQSNRGRGNTTGYGEQRGRSSDNAYREQSSRGRGNNTGHGEQIGRGGHSGGGQGRGYGYGEQQEGHAGFPQNRSGATGNPGGLNTGSQDCRTNQPDGQLQTGNGAQDWRRSQPQIGNQSSASGNSAWRGGGSGSHMQPRDANESICRLNTGSQDCRTNQPGGQLQTGNGAQDWRTRQPQIDKEGSSSSNSAWRGGGGGSHMQPRRQSIPGTWSAPATLDELMPGLSLDVNAPEPSSLPAMSIFLPREDQPPQSLEPVPTTSIRSTLVAVQRPGPGTAGKTAQVHANHFRVTFKPNANICHYDVDIKPNITSKATARALQKQLIANYKSEFGNILTVYDGSKSIFAPRMLPFECKEFPVVLKEETREKSYNITVRHVATLNRNHLEEFLRGRLIDTPSEHLQALDVVLREFLIKSYTPVGRSFYTPALGTQPLRGGLVGWNGFYQSLRPTSQGLALNVDIAATAFYGSMLVTDYVLEMFESERKFNLHQQWTDATRARVRRALARLKIEVTHRKTPRRYRIMGLSPNSARHTRFALDGEGEMSISEYFLRKYNYQIRYPDIPCLQVQAKGTSYLPMEVCKICEGQKYIGKLGDTQTSNLMDMACVPAKRRADTTERIMLRDDGPGRGEYVSSFGLEVSTKMTVLRSRILEPPKLRYGNGGQSVVEPVNGQWNLNRSRVTEGATVSNWAFISFDNRVDLAVANEFARSLSERCSAIGVTLANNTLIPPVLRKRDDLEARRLEEILQYTHTEACKALQQKNRPGQLQLLICVFGDKHPAYGDLKRICETNIGVITQCCLRKHLVPTRNRRTGQVELSSQYLANLGLKINAKFGGVNNKLVKELPQMCKVFDKPTLILGADVTHPNPGDETSPSIAAVVGNVDWPSAIKYTARVRAQSHRKEIIEDLKEIVMELARGFRNSTGRMPERVIMFRDGVSESQFDAVLQQEVNYLKEAMAIVGGYNYNPRITWVVVQKRHHTRFFPADSNQDKTGNILAGVVVDTVVTHPSQFDFFLCSHAGLKGTSKPTHYHVLYDDNHFSSDDLQGMINNMCYTYARCTRSLSIVPPAHYAHLAAYRARLHLETQGGGSSDSASQRSVHGRAGANNTVRPLPPIKDHLKNAMYFC